MSNLRLAVIGVGHLGQIHARLSKQVGGVELVAVVDSMAAAREAVATELGAAAYADHRALYGKIDAAIIATPSRAHYAVAIDLIEHGVHVLVEKPLTLNVGDADELISEAANRELVLQVGHVERFNPALLAAAPHLEEPKYIDAVRTGPFTCRSTDIGVVLDLMIHDIDVVLSLVDDDVVSVDALGATVIGPNEDWAQARLTFAGGCVASFFASRVSRHARRAMHVVCRECAADIDFGGRQATIMHVSDSILNGEIDVNCLGPADRAAIKDRLFTDYLPVAELPVRETNALLEEQREFAAAIRGEGAIRVSGRDGRRALDVAEHVLAGIAAHRWEGSAAGAIGPRFQTATNVLPGPHWSKMARRKAG